MKSHVLCISTEHFRRQTKERGFVSALNLDLHRLFSSEHAWLAPRAEIETNPDFLQIIPYLVLRSGSDVIAYERKGDEDRLHRYLSVGFGGHVEAKDAVDIALSELISPIHAIENAAAREFDEEVGFDYNDYPHQLLGCIYDTEDEVSSVHLGVVTLVHIGRDDFDVLGERDEFQAVNPNDDMPITSFELWSRHVIQHLRGVPLWRDAVIT